MNKWPIFFAIVLGGEIGCLIVPGIVAGFRGKVA